MNGYAFGSIGTEGPTDNETAEIGAGGMAVDEAEPSFMFDVPVGTTVIPLRVNFVIEAQAGTVNIALAAWDVINRFSAGGVAAVAARNLHGGNPRSSVVTNLLSGDTAITALASSAQRTSVRGVRNWCEVTVIKSDFSLSNCRSSPYFLPRASFACLPRFVSCSRRYT